MAVMAVFIVSFAATTVDTATCWPVALTPEN